MIDQHRMQKRSAALRLPATGDDAKQRLDGLSASSLTFSCPWCGQYATVTVTELIAIFGPDRDVHIIGRHVIKCGDKRLRRDGDCPLKPSRCGGLLRSHQYLNLCHWGR